MAGAAPNPSMLADMDVREHASPSRPTRRRKLDAEPAETSRDFVGFRGFGANPGLWDKFHKVAARGRTIIAIIV